MRERLAYWSTLGAFLVMVLDLGGSLYEHLVLDPAWPTNFALIQRQAGGVSRTAFWIPIHTALTVLLALALWAGWRMRAVRVWLLGAVALYVAMRLWTFAYFVPRALLFERYQGAPQALAREAETWVRLSLLRFPVVLASAIALWVAVRLLQARRPVRAPWKARARERDEAVPPPEEMARHPG